MRALIVLIVLTCAASLIAEGSAPPAGATGFSVVEATIPEMQRAMEQGRVTSHELVVQYLTRIARFDKRINAAITVNARAIEEADARDADRKAGHVRGRCTAFRSR